jgi:cytochrome c-type biogenesis protein CcmH
MNKLIVAAFTLLFIILLTPAIPAYAVIEQVEFETTELEQRYKNLIDELRCLVCQNQNLADSDAPLAKDLRTITATMLQDGASDDEIKAFMRERYGDFVLYRPPFNASTAFLWLGPIVILVIVLIGVITHIRRRQEIELLKPAHAESEARRIKARNLLRDTPTLDQNDSQS